MSLQPVWIPDNAPTECFPDVEYALEEPNGLLAVGGDLGVERLLYAYRKGIFPWYSEGQPILWWSPDPRAVLLPNQIKISRSLRKTIRRGHFEIRINSAFASVMRACAEPRPGQEGTWIIDEMVEAYERLHGLGWAHSIETWADDRLAGGLYGVAVGTVFFGESMFTRVTDASKVALVALAELGFELIDCQLPNDHLLSLGAQLLTRGEFTRSLEKMCDRELPLAMRATGLSDAPTGALGTAIRFRLSRAAQDRVTPKSIRNDSNPIGTPSEALAGSGEDLPGENRR